MCVIAQELACLHRPTYIALREHVHALPYLSVFFPVFGCSPQKRRPNNRAMTFSLEQLFSECFKAHYTPHGTTLHTPRTEHMTHVSGIMNTCTTETPLLGLITSHWLQRKSLRNKLTPCVALWSNALISIWFYTQALIVVGRGLSWCDLVWFVAEKERCDHNV